MTNTAQPPTPEEIERRVAQNDTAQSARRAATARDVGELARRHAAVAKQIVDIEQQLGALLAAADEVVTINELARFTDVPVAKLIRWRAIHKPHRAKRKKPAPSENREQHAAIRQSDKPTSNSSAPAATGASAEARLASRDDALVP